MIMKLNASILVFLATVFGISFFNIAYADLGIIPIDPEGGALQSGSLSTNVSMDYEKVVLTYSKPENRDIKSDSGEVSGTDVAMKVHVSAIFKMINNGDKIENINVFFPADNGDFARGVNDGSIINFKVNGKAITEKNAGDVTISLYGFEQAVSSFQWKETFYPKKENQIAIEYDSVVHKESVYNVYYLSYVLGTGRGWQGSIKKGDITFVLPEGLTAYAVSGNPPQMQENKLPFIVEGNSIYLSFSNYEPDPGEVILLSVYDFDRVDKIEQLKKEQANFSNIFKIAGLFRELSYGGHCVFCTGTTTEEAKKYYNLALDKAVSKDELNLVLGSFTYGFADSKEENYKAQMDSLLNMFNFKNCAQDDLKCKEEIYASRGYLGYTPFGGFFNSYDKINNKAPNDDFLIKYADKMQAYDPAISAVVNNFLKEISVIVKASLESVISPEPTVSPIFTLDESKISKNTAGQQARYKNILLIAGAVILTVFLAIFALSWLFKKIK